MTPIIVKSIDLKRFDALAAHTRSPAAAYISEEIAWYANESETVLGVLLRDKIDNDFVGVLLGRDESGMYRCFDVQASIETAEEATTWLEGAIRWNSRDDVKTFPQGNRDKPVDPFEPISPIEKLGASFVKIQREAVFAPARRIISEIMPHFVDIDGNFLEQFQTTGFDARLWELYLFSYLNEEQLFIDRTHNRPDFVVTKYAETVAIEATIVGRRKDNPVSFFKTEPKLLHPEEIRERQAHEIPIRFGSPLFSKLKKEYWKLEHVKGKPLVLAIADFHDDQSMLWTSTALINYLFGVRHDHHFDADGKLVIEPIQLDKHELDGKVIPSGFFFQPDAENVSAIMFSASGTISKFNRIGRQAGFNAPGVIMFRFGTHHDHNPNANLPKPFKYLVDESCNETLAEGLSMFHNPNAKHPVPQHLFPSIAHHRFVEGQIASDLPEFHPYASQTIHLQASK